MPEPAGVRLPGYVWDRRLRGGRFRTVYDDGRLGRIVAPRDIVQQLRMLTDRSGRQFANLAEDAFTGRITVADFQRALIGELRALYNANTALALGGWQRLGPAEWGRNGGLLREEYRHLAAFAQELADGKLSLAEARARAQLYADNAYARYWQEDLRLKQEAGFREERLVTVGDDRVCASCRAAERQGYAPLGTFVIPLHFGCRCEKVYR